MDSEEFETLYKELRGTRSSAPVLDAKTSFTNRDYDRAYQLVTEAHEIYKESRQRILKQDPEQQVDRKAKDRDRQVRRIVRKQEKAQELLAKFEEMLPKLERLVERQKARRQKHSESDSASPVAKKTTTGSEQKAVAEKTIAEPKAVDASFARAFSDCEGDEQLEVVSKYFEFRPVMTRDDVQPGEFYLLREGGNGILIVANEDPMDEDQFLCIDYFNSATVVPMTSATMVQLSNDRKLVLLLSKPQAAGRSSSG